MIDTHPGGNLPPRAGPWIEPAANRRGECVQVARARHGAPFRCVLLSSDWVGALVHYWAGRSVDCKGGPDECVHCHWQRRPAAYFYAYCYVKLTGQKRLLEVTQRGLDYCPELLALRGRLLGVGLEVSRAVDFRGPVVLRLTEESVRPPDGYQEGDVKEQLRRLWDAPTRSEPWGEVVARYRKGGHRDA
jgi:hypothetical protein